MIRKYTDEQRKWLNENIPGHFLRETLYRFNAKFSTNITYTSIRNYTKNNKIQSGMMHKTRPETRTSTMILTDEEIEVFAENQKGKSTIDMMIFCADSFGKILTPSQVRGIRKRNHLASGRDTKFKPGHISHNKEKKGLCFPGTEKSWFKKGSLPHNTLPVNSEIEDTDGYTRIKIAMPDVWVFKHRLIWEQAHGPIPPQKILIFLDGNKKNLSLENLCLISQNEHLQLNKGHFRQNSPELTQAALNMIRLTDRINELE